MSAQGISAYIAKAAADGDYPKIVPSVAEMSIFVIMFNACFGARGLAERRMRLN